MEEKYFKEVVGEGGAKTYEEVPVFKAFENEESFNEALSKSSQSSSSKAKGEILQELGIKSVAEFKEQFNLDEYKTLKASATDKDNLLTSTKTELEDLKTKYETLVKENQENMEKFVLSQYDIPEALKDDFKTLAKAGVKPKTETENGVSLEESAKSLYERWNITQVKNGIKIGGTGKVTTPSIQEENKRLQQL